MNGAAMTELIRDFLSPALFYKRLADIDIDFFCGVPDSLLKGSVWRQRHV